MSVTKFKAFFKNWVEIVSLLLWLGSLYFLMGHPRANSQSAAPGVFELMKIHLIWLLLYLQIPVLAYFRFREMPVSNKQQLLIMRLNIWKVHWLKTGLSIMMLMLFIITIQRKSEPVTHSAGFTIMFVLLLLVLLGLVYLNRFARMIDGKEEGGRKTPKIGWRQVLPFPVQSPSDVMLAALMLIMPFLIVFSLLFFNWVK